MKTSLRKNSLVVLNHNVDATIYRVVEVNGWDVRIIDIGIELTHSNQRGNFVDKSLLYTPNRAQLQYMEDQAKAAS